MRILLLCAVLLTGGQGAQAAPDQAGDVTKAFLAYQKAILNSDGKTAVRYVSANTLLYYDAMFKNAREADKTALLKLSFVNRLMALAMRVRTPRDQLLAPKFTGESVFVFAVEKGMVGKSTVIDLKVERVTINDRFAKVSVSRNGKEYAPFHFYLEQGVWKVDLEQMAQMSNMMMLQLLKRENIAEEEFIFKALESVSGRKVTETVYDPPKKP